MEIYANLVVPLRAVNRKFAREHNLLIKEDNPLKKIGEDVSFFGGNSEAREKQNKTKVEHIVCKGECFQKLQNYLDNNENDQLYNTGNTHIM